MEGLQLHSENLLLNRSIFVVVSFSFKVFVLYLKPACANWGGVAEIIVKGIGGWRLISSVDEKMDGSIWGKRREVQNE